MGGERNPQSDWVDSLGVPLSGGINLGENCSHFVTVRIENHRINPNIAKYGAPRASPWFPKTIPTYAKASVGHPPASEIRRSMNH